MQNRFDSKNSVGIKEFFTRSALAKELKTFNENQIKEIENLEPDKSNTSEVLEFSQFLYEDYKFNNLILSDEKIRKQFSFAMAQCWFFTRVFLQEHSNLSFLNCFASPLSVILTTDYELILDEIETIENLTGKKINDIEYPRPAKNPIQYKNRFSNWNFLLELKRASLCDRKTLILIANAMSSQTQLLEYSRIERDTCVEKSIDSLCKYGLVNLEIPLENLLKIITYQKICGFAIENGVERVPPRKNEVINLIMEEINHEIISNFVFSELNNPAYGYNISKETFLLPTIPNGKIFQDYIRNELNRLALYIEYIGCVENKRRTIISPVLKKNKPGKRPGDYYEKHSHFDNFEKAISYEDNIAELIPDDAAKVKKYWDKNCEGIFHKICEKNMKPPPAMELCSEIISYWYKIGVLEDYKKETYHSTYKNHWYWLLSNYCSTLLPREKTNKLTPRIKSCAGCGKRFREYSVPNYIAEKVDFNIRFCYRCYRYIFGHRFMANNTSNFRIPKNEMLNYLFELSKAAEIIPTRNYMENILLPSRPSIKQEEVGKTLLKMPAFDIYIEKFGNWLNCLSQAGVLENGYRKTSRGIQCTAKDGHLCLSLGEKTIDDWLSDHKIEHEKEVLYPYDEKLNPNELSRTDWKVGKVFIEYAGLMNDTEYAKKMEIKKELALKNQIRLIIITSSDLFRLDEILKDLIS